MTETDPSLPGDPRGIDPTNSELGEQELSLEQIGPYRVLESLGEGGMGVVYIAEQTEPVRRQVALKIIKPGMDTKQVVARFEAERQALAMMDHPSIASVFDGGATETGRPYFVMELVRGIPITEYCDMHKLSVHDRLKLFIGVCQAIQHAHQKGVIHRDLKPSNILVADQDGKPVPKVIDFGIAKAMGHRLTDKTLHTERGLMIGTPAYMSPEQAEMTGLDVDTRTDIYSLGVILYELLAGDLPFDPKDLKGYQAIVTLRETEPPTPSTRFRSLGDRRQGIAERRRSDPTSLARKLRGDLDWIIMKAMEKDRKRRYETTNGLALEIKRHLNDEPVLARAPSARYRTSKFIRRHKAGVAFAGALLVLLVAFGMTMSIQAARIAQERDRANLEAAAAQQVTDFLVGLFEISDPSEARGNTITAREILDKGAERIGEELADQPLTQARVMSTIGRVYYKLGLYEQAVGKLEDALTLRSNAPSGETANVAENLLDLARAYWLQGKWTEAEDYSLRSLDMVQASLGPAHPLAAKALSNLGAVYFEQGDLPTAETYFEQALAIREEAFEPNHPDVIQSLMHVAAVYGYQGKLDEAESLYRRTLEIREATLGPDHPDLWENFNNLATVYYFQGNYARAESLYLRSLDIAEAVYGPEARRTALILGNLGDVYLQLDKDVKAEPLFQRALAIYKRTLEPDHPDIAQILNGLAGVYRELHRYEEAEELYQQALSIRERVLEPDHPDVAETLEGYAQLLRSMERAEEAEILEGRAESVRANMAQ